MTTMIASPRLARTGSVGPLSESIIPATRGTFYVYQSLFTDSDPLYAFLDCKANKRRPVEQINDLGREVHVHFEFDGVTGVHVSSVKAALAAGKLGEVNAEFDDVYVATADLAIEDFYALCARRDSAKLIELCESACSRRETSLRATPEMIVAFMTSGGKFGLFLVKEITLKSVGIEACHFLAP